MFACRRRLAFLCVAGIVVAAEPAAALRVDLNPVGGTAISGSGDAGDTLVLSIDVTMEADDEAFAFFFSLQWDQDGGDVLDLVGASEPGPLRFGEQWLAPPSSS